MIVYYTVLSFLSIEICYSLDACSKSAHMFPSSPRLSLLPSKSAFFDQQIKENQKVVSKALQWVPLSNKKQSRRFRRSLIHKKNDYKRKTKTNIEKETYERFLNKHLNCNKFQYSQKS
jgi:hypothetical protein